MTIMYFGPVRFLVEQDERDRNGMRILNIVSVEGSTRLVATKDIREKYWLLSNGQRWDEGDVCIKEEI